LLVLGNHSYPLLIVVADKGILKSKEFGRLEFVLDLSLRLKVRWERIVASSSFN